MKRNLAHKLLLLIMAIALVVALFACSPRGNEGFPDDDNVITGSDTVITKENIVTENLSKEEIDDKVHTAVDNYQSFYSAPDDAEWFIIDLSVKYSFEHFWLDSKEKYNKSSAFSLDFKGNIHLEDNSKSEVFLQLRNANNIPVLAVYYADGYTYVVVGTQKYYMRELNFTQIGGMLSGVLQDAGVDVIQLLSAVLAGGNTGIAAIDGLGIMSLVGTILFDEYSCYYTQVDKEGDGVIEQENYEYTLKLNELLNMLSGSGLSIPGLFSVSFGTFWNLIGLNLDPILDQFLGFSIAELGAKDWPEMTARLKALSKLETIAKADADGEIMYEDDYLMKGLGLSIVTENDVEATREAYANVYPEDMEEDELIEEYEVDIELQPLLYRSNKKTDIAFGNLGLNADGREDTYVSGGIGNLGLGATLYFENDDNGGLTINRVLGDAFDINLGALGDMPIELPYAARYELGLDVKLGLDFMDGAETKAEININFNDTPLISAYLENKTLYLNFENLKSYTDQILPNVRLEGLDINSLLSGVFDVIEPYFNPDYVPPVVPEGGEAQNASSFVSNAEGSVDVMSIIQIVLDNFEFPGREDYLYNADGTVKVDANGRPIPNDWNISLDFTSEEITDLIGMFTTLNGSLGEDLHLNLSFNQKDPINTLELVVDVTDSFRLGLKLDSLTYMKEPNWKNAHMASPSEQSNYVDLSIYKTENGDYIYANRNYNVMLQGDVTLGVEETTDTGLDLSGLIGVFVDNLLLSIGTSYTGSTTLSYLIQGNIDIIDMAQTELRITIYVGPQNNKVPLIHVIYLGIEDTLYIDLSGIEEINFASLGKLPRLKYENLGLRDTLAGLDIASIIAGILTNDETNAQNSVLNKGITIDTSDPKFLENVSKTAYFALLFNDELSSGTFLGGNSEFKAELLKVLALNDEGTTEGGEGTAEGGGVDIMAILGAALWKVDIDALKGTLSVYVASTALSSILTILLAPVDDFGNPLEITMPKVNAFVEINLANHDYGTNSSG